MPFYEHLISKTQRDYLTPDRDLQAVREKAHTKITTEMARYRAVFDAVPMFATKHTMLNAASVEIGAREELSSDDYTNFLHGCKFFKPWKKGAYRLFGIDIDAEWRGDLKWQRLTTKLGDVEGQTIADLGCHNGYFMFRLAGAGARVIGFEPNLRCYFNFHWMQRYAQAENIFFEPFGLEHLNLYPQYFDVILCMGILYHQTDPITVLRKIHHSLRRGGRVFIDCMGVAGEEAKVLVPRQKYAGASGIWHLPTASALHNWLARTNFRDIEVFHNAYLLPTEQRATPWAEVKSLADFVCFHTHKTVENCDAPRRIYVQARR